MKKVSAKEVIQSDAWIITNKMQGLSNNVRIDAKKRFIRSNADEPQNFSDWIKISTAKKYYSEKGIKFKIDY